MRALEPLSLQEGSVSYIAGHYHAERRGDISVLTGRARSFSILSETSGASCELISAGGRLGHIIGG